MIINKNEQVSVTPAPAPTLEDPDCKPTKNIGLRGIVVADSQICKVDGQMGKLLYRGFDIVPLAENSTFEEVIYLLLHNDLPTPNQLQDLQQTLAAERYLPDEVIAAMKSFPAGAAPMDVLQAMIPALAAHDPDLTQTTRAASVHKTLRLIARFPLLVSAWQRIRNGQEVIEAKEDLSHAANFLYTMFGEVPDAQTARDMDVALILHAEHSFNASTFSCRQVASTMAHEYASVAAAVGALSGELHGGANERVLNMLQAIGSPDNAREYVTKTLDDGGKIMGMGHAVYKVLDPRAKFLGPMAKRLSEKAGDTTLYDTAEAVREITAEEFKKRKNITIYPNVDFYSGTAYHMLGIPSDLFTPIFAISRIAGWMAHYIEEKFAEAQPKPALYRPRAEYVGRYCGPEGCQFIERGKR